MTSPLLPCRTPCYSEPTDDWSTPKDPSTASCDLYVNTEELADRISSCWDRLAPSISRSFHPIQTSRSPQTRSVTIATLSSKPGHWPSSCESLSSVLRTSKERFVTPIETGRPIRHVDSNDLRSQTYLSDPSTQMSKLLQINHLAGFDASSRNTLFIRRIDPTMAVVGMTTLEEG